MKVYGARSRVPKAQSRQLWVNLAAFVPMPFLLLGISWVLRPRPRRLCFIGAGLYGAAFSYFLYSTIYALEKRVPDYQTLWSELGIPYTVAGVLMIFGGCLFAVEALRSSRLPKMAISGIGKGFSVI